MRDMGVKAECITGRSEIRLTFFLLRLIRIMIVQMKNCSLKIIDCASLERRFSLFLGVKTKLKLPIKQ